MHCANANEYKKLGKICESIQISEFRKAFEND